MNEYIDKNVLINNLDKHFADDDGIALDEYWSHKEVRKVIKEQQPIDAVKIIRCGDCIYHRYLTCSNESGINGYVTDDDYCSYAKQAPRKENL